MNQPEQLQPQPAQPYLEPPPTVQTPISSPQEGQIPTTPMQPGGEQRSSRKILLIVIILLVILLGVGVLVYFILNPQSANKQASLSTSVPTNAPTTLSPTPKITEAPHYTGSQTINLMDISGGNSSGTVSRNITIGRATHVITALLPDPTEGQFYQAWMIKPGVAHFNAGRLIKNDEGVYRLETNFQFDPENSPFTTFDTIHNNIAISLESVEDDIIETIILEGTFTQ